MEITYRAALKLVYILCSLLFSSVGWSSGDIPREAVPGWVVPTKLPAIDGFPQDKVQNGVYYLLIDNQIIVTQGVEPHYYHHYADYIVNQNGVESNSQINIDYDPSYQKLSLHSLHIIRNGKAIDKFDTAQMKVIQREEEMDDLIYSGRMTLNIILDDVRVGDIIEYSFSRQGMNPVYQNVFGYTHDLNWSVPVGRLSLRLIWNKPVALHYELKNSALKMSVTQTANGSEYLLESDNIDPLKVDRNTPSWFSPWGRVYFSELKSWGEVARWSGQLYSDVVVADDNINRLVERIKSQHKDVDEQISAALRFVQDEIRYLGIELGKNTHKPTPAFETLRNRYGDCKDKTVLFMTLLKGLGIEAHPALVNTETRLYDTLPTVRAFDHVITYLEHKGKHYWLDPTRSYQYGGIDAIHQPDYGLALVVRKGTQALMPMSPTMPKYGVFVKDRYVLHTEGAVEFTSETENYGWNAERQNRLMAEKGRDRLQQEYLEFFQRYYPGTAVEVPVEYSDDPVYNKFSSMERYRIDHFWEDKPDKKRYEADFYANIISPSLKIPDEAERIHPLALTHPEHLEQTIELNFVGNNWAFDDESVVEDNDLFRFSRDVKFDTAAQQLVLRYAYQSKTDHIPPEKYHDYLAALKKVKTLMNYGIYWEYPTKTIAAEDNPDFWSYLTPATVMAAYGALYLLVILMWRVERWRRPDTAEAVFFPVSMVKLIAMWVLSFGVYGIYWFYKNFNYIKQQENNAIMPVARGLFNPFWYYPLWSKLKEDSLNRFEGAHLPAKSTAIVLALAFFVVSAVGSIDALVLPSVILGVLLVLPLANYILFVNSNTSPALMSNSRWSFRHYTLALLSAPLLVMSAGSEVGVLANDAVIEGSRILDHDIKIMQRRGIIQPGDKIDYFYSDAFLFLNDDGNGFTQRHVFSYWKDEDGTLSIEQAAYSEIKDIEVEWNREFGGNSTVTVTRSDDSWFLLYVSNTDHKDTLFVKKLKQRWQTSVDVAEREQNATSR